MSRLIVVVSVCAAAGCTSPVPDSLGSRSYRLQSVDQALSVIQAHHEAHVAAVLEALPSDDEARLVNTLAWYDEDPRELFVDRGVRG